MSYTVKIIDNDSGIAVVDRTDARAIIGAVVTPEGVQGTFATLCTAEEMALGIFTAKRVCDIGMKNAPEVGLMAAYLEMGKDEIPGVVVDMSQFKEKGD